MIRKKMMMVPESPPLEDHYRNVFLHLQLWSVSICVLLLMCSSSRRWWWEQPAGSRLSAQRCSRGSCSSSMSRPSNIHPVTSRTWPIKNYFFSRVLPAWRATLDVVKHTKTWENNSGLKGTNKIWNIQGNECWLSELKQFKLVTWCVLLLNGWDSLQSCLLHWDQKEYND